MEFRRAAGLTFSYALLALALLAVVNALRVVPSRLSGRS
jgi:hypothetical protein